MIKQYITSVTWQWIFAVLDARLHSLWLLFLNFFHLLNLTSCSPTSQAVMEVLDNISTVITEKLQCEFIWTYKSIWYSKPFNFYWKTCHIWSKRNSIKLVYKSLKKQHTVLLTHESVAESITRELPQGPMLGSLLFLIYVNGIQYAVANALLNWNLMILIYHSQ